MISKQLTVTGYADGYYTVGEFTQPRWQSDGLTKPITGTTPRYAAGDAVVVPHKIVKELEELADAIYTGTEETSAHTRDWWPGTMLAQTAGDPATPDAVTVEVSSVEQIQRVMRISREHSIPVTVAAGRSNVTGSTLPMRGGIVLDVHTMNKILSFNETDFTVECEPGIFGDVLEEHLQNHWKATVGHWPQSLGLSTVGGWVACRGAGQLSTRYGKIEDMVTELDVVLPNGELVTLGGCQRAAVGPDLKQVFVGSEGMLGVITRVVLRAHPLADYANFAAFEYEDFAAGLNACRDIMRTGATPAVLRLWDNLEAGHYFDNGGKSILLIADEGEPELVDVTVKTAAEAAGATGTKIEAEPIFKHWLKTRFNVPSQNTFDGENSWLADTLEMTASWSKLPAIYDRVCAAMMAVPGMLACTAHQSHAYTDSACVYFTFQAVVPIADRATWYRAAWDAANEAIIAEGGQLSHHHGIGLVRTPYVQDSLQGGYGVLRAIKDSLDPEHLLNPGKFDF